MLIELEKARTRNNVVRIFREELDGPDGWTDGFVVDANEKWFCSNWWMIVFVLMVIKFSF